MNCTAPVADRRRPVFAGEEDDLAALRGWCCNGRRVTASSVAFNFFSRVLAKATMPASAPFTSSRSPNQRRGRDMPLSAYSRNNDRLRLSGLCQIETVQRPWRPAYRPEP